MMAALKNMFIRLSGLGRTADTSVWMMAGVTFALIVFTCLPVAQSLFSPLDRSYRQFVAKHDVYGSIDQVSVIMIDNKSVQQLGVNKCFSQSSHARMLERLHSADSVVIDMMLLCAERDGPELAAAIARHGRVVLPSYVSPEGVNPDIVLRPDALLMSRAASTGQRSIVVGGDDLVNGFLPYINVPATGEVLAHVIIEAIRVARKALPIDRIEDYIQDSVSSLGKRQPGVMSMRLPTRFHLKRYSYVDVLNGAIPASQWRGKIVFIGSSVTDTGRLYHLSAGSHPDSGVHGTEASAMMAEALLEGHVLGKPPFLVSLGINAMTLTGTLLICLLFSGWRMYTAMALWFAVYVAVNLLALLHWSYWLPPGAVMAAGVGVFALCGWRRAGTVSASLVRAYRQLQQDAPDPLTAVSPGARDARSASLKNAWYFRGDKVARIMKDIRGWQSGYVEMMDTLPYAVFVEEHGQLVTYNARGRALLGAFDIHAPSPRLPDHPILNQVREAITEARASGHMRSFEMTLQARTHTIMVAPFSDGARYDSTASLICVLDIHDLRAEIESDQVTLRHMAHDMRSPLATVRSMLEERLQANSKADAGFIANIHKLVDYSLRVTQGYTDLSRAGHLDRRAFIEIDVDDLIAEAVDRLWHTALAKDILLTTREGAAPACVHGNRNMLLRAMVNLLDNAIKYSPPHTQVNIHAVMASQWVEISVEDQGIGVSQEAQRRLFEPFFQVSATPWDAGLGVGLGLPFVMTVAQQHMGTVNVTSSPGSGSCFTLRLPVTQPSAPVEMSLALQ